MFYDLDMVKQRFDSVVFGKTVDVISLWKMVESTISQRPEVPEIDEMETEEGYFCYLDGRRVGYLADYVNYRFGFSWKLYKRLFGYKADAQPSFSMMYLKAYHERAFTDRPKPAFAISPEQTFMGQDRLRCMIDGEPMVFLKRHLKRNHGMAFEEYLDYCGLPPDYPSRALYSSAFDLRNMTVYARPHFQQCDNPVRPLTI